MHRWAFRGADGAGDIRVGLSDMAASVCAAHLIPHHAGIVPEAQNGQAGLGGRLRGWNRHCGMPRWAFRGADGAGDIRVGLSDMAASVCAAHLIPHHAETVPKAQNGHAGPPGAPERLDLTLWHAPVGVSRR